MSSLLLSLIIFVPWIGAALIAITRRLLTPKASRGLALLSGGLGVGRSGVGGARASPWDASYSDGRPRSSR